MRRAGQVPNVLHKSRKNKPVATAGEGRGGGEQSFKGMLVVGTVSNYIPLQRPSLNTPRFSITKSLNEFY